MSSAEQTFRIVVLASGGGTNLQAILDQLHGKDGIEVAGVASDKPDAFALERAAAAKVPTGVFARGDWPDRKARDLAMADWIDSVEADLVVLAGYMQLVSPEFVARFEREAQTIASLEFPGIVPVYDYGDENGQTYLVMRYMPGGSLADLLKQGPLPIDEVKRIFERLTSALDYVHSKGIIHRDLKPDNIFIEQDGTPKILDFGMARLEMASADESDSSPVKTGPGVMLGTVPYMSPEQVCGLPVDWRSDLFSFGCVMYDMLTATVIFSRKQLVTSMSAILKDPPPSLASFGVEAPPELEAIMQRAVHKDREQRYQSAIDIAEDLRKL